MKKIDNFVNVYSVSKTLRFKAVPIGKTEENIRIKRLIEEDEERAENYYMPSRTPKSNCLHQGFCVS